MLYAADTWGAAILCAVVFCLAVYPILCLIEKWRGYISFFALPGFVYVVISLAQSCYFSFHSTVPSSLFRIPQDVSPL